MSQVLSKLFIQGLSSILKPVFGLAYREFIKQLSQPQATQNQVKTQIIQKLVRTAYGSTLNLETGAHWRQIPLVDYEALEPWVNRQRQHPDRAILTPEKIRFWQWTSGSNGPKKWVPYTDALIASLSRMCCIWIYDLMRYGPPFSSYKHYLCISPQIGSESAGIDDTDYLNAFLRGCLDRFIIRVPGPFANVESFRFALALALLEAEDLEGFSLWSPGFLTTQLAFMQEQRQALQTALRGHIRAERLHLLAEPEIPWSQIWPQLQLISCWDRHHAGDQAQVLKNYFPGVFLQGKGLLATEAPMTLPLIPAQGFLPLINRVVFEFLDSQGEVRSLSELELGITYELVISPLGGFPRYRIGDRVQVSHWYFNTPCLDFCGRGEEVSDLVGEKLTLGFVTDCLQKLGYLQWGICSLVPILGTPPYYCLLLERSSFGSGTIARSLETALQANVHYQRARQFEQLGALQVVINPHISRLLQGNKRLGDCKYSLLVNQPLHPEQLMGFD